MGSAEIEARRKQRLQEALLAADLNYEHIPIEVEEFGVSFSVDELGRQVKDLDTRMGMVERDISSMEGVLLGRDGKNGAIERLETGQKELRTILESTTKEITESIKTLSNLHISDINELNTKDLKLENSINEINETSGESKKKIDKHLEEHKTADERQSYKKYARQWDLFKQVTGVILGAAVTVGLFYLFGIGG